MEKTCQDCYSFWEEGCKGKPEPCDKWKSVDDPDGVKAQERKQHKVEKQEQVEQKKKQVREKVFRTKIVQVKELPIPIPEPPAKKSDRPFSKPFPPKVISIDSPEPRPLPIMTPEFPQVEISKTEIISDTGPNQVYNRESWLTEAVDLLRPILRIVEYNIPDKIKVSCGWPKGNVRKTIGQCWDKKSSTGNICEIFISPLLDLSLDKQGVLATLVHELGHAILGNEIKHKKPFKKYMSAVGLGGSIKATEATPGLILKFESIVDTLGPYPHNSMFLQDKEGKKQTTRLIKAGCSTCDYVIRVTRIHMEEKGLPICPQCKIPFIEME